MTKNYLLLFFSVFSAHILTAQSNELYSKFVKDSTEKIYYESWPQKTPFYNGRQYYGYVGGIKGHAFHVETWQNGAVFYENMWYYDVPLLFDTYSGDIVTKVVGGMTYIVVREKVKAFLVGEDRFILLGKQYGQSVPDDFYQDMLVGDESKKIKLYIRRKKYLNERAGYSTVLEREFYKKDEFYVFSSGEYNRVKTKKQVLKLIGDKRKAALIYLKKNDIKFKRDPEEYITLLIQFYNNQ